MRHLKTFAAVLAIMICSNSFAGSETPVKPKNTFSTEVGKFLKDADLVIKEDVQGRILFILDSERKMKILHVSFQDPYAKKFIGEKLMDQVLKDETLEVGKTYAMPLLNKM